MGERILIAGFGPAGAALALAMHQAGVPAGDLLIVDPAAEQDREARGPDSRILALNAGSCRFLESLGIWPSIARNAHPMRSIALSDTGLQEQIRPASLGFEQEPDGQPLAQLVPLGLLQSRLREAVRETGIRISATSVESFQEVGSELIVRHGGISASVALLVAADGARSTIRRLAGIPFHGWAYGQTAITGVLHHSGEHRGEAVQHFLPAGPFALLPLEEGQSSMVWSERGDVAERMLKLSPADLLSEIESRAAGWRSKINATGMISSHPLSLGIARRFFGRRLALVADAAHQVHPLAGQGLNLGFADAAELAELLVEHLRLGLDPGDSGLLERYQAHRRPPALAIATMTETLNRLFSNDLGPLRMIRDIGLGIVNRSGPLKSMFRARAAGNGAGEPKLFRGETL